MPAGSLDQPENGFPESDPTVAYMPAGKPGAASGRSVAGAFGWALVFESGPLAGLTYVLGEGDTHAGRDPDSDLVLDDVTVSRHHAIFTVDEGGLRVVDLGSLNGTYLNGERHDTAQLEPADEVIIGKFQLVVARGGV